MNQLRHTYLSVLYADQEVVASDTTRGYVELLRTQQLLEIYRKSVSPEALAYILTGDSACLVKQECESATA